MTSPTAQKRALIAKRLKEMPDRSDRFIASLTGADHRTIARHRFKLAERGEIPQTATTRGRDGRTRSVVHERIEPLPSPAVVVRKALVSMGGRSLPGFLHEVVTGVPMSHQERRLQARLAVIGSLQSQLAESRQRLVDIERQIQSGSIAVNREQRRQNARDQVADMEARLHAARQSAARFADLSGFPPEAA